MLDVLLGLTGHRPAAGADGPLRDELLSIEGLEERAKSLAARFTVDPNPRRLARSVFPRFEENARVLHQAYRILADDVHRGEFVTPAGEWLLDNFHLVTSEIVDVRRNLPRGYYRQLPKLALRELAGDARVYALAVELIRHSDSRLERQQLVRFLNSYQTVAPLTIGELWAWPSMLKLALIENLRRLADEVLAARDARHAADAYVARVDAPGQPAAPGLAVGASDRPSRAPARARARVRPPPLAGARRRRGPPRRAAADVGRRDPERAPAPGRRAGLGGQRHHQPPPLRHARLEPPLRGRQPGRARAAARSRPARTGAWTS